MLATSAKLSLFIQFVTGIIDFYGLQIPLPQNKLIYKELLEIELFVQTVEFMYYIWLVMNLNKFEGNITVTRYFDWMITTPTMLLTLMAYLNDKENGGSLKLFVKQNKSDVILILILNWLMLFIGLLGELGILDEKIAVTIGFIPFIYYFNVIHKKFLDKNEKDNGKIFLFWFYLVTWSLYGIAALFQFELKNTFYNILDLFSKNFLGIFLVYVIYKNRVEEKYIK